jgi:hypothetical protein
MNDRLYLRKGARNKLPSDYEHMARFGEARTDSVRLLRNLGYIYVPVHHYITRSAIKSNFRSLLFPQPPLRPSTSSIPTCNAAAYAVAARLSGFPPPSFSKHHYRQQPTTSFAALILDFLLVAELSPCISRWQDVCAPPPRRRPSGRRAAVASASPLLPCVEHGSCSMVGSPLRTYVHG